MPKQLRADAARNRDRLRSAAAEVIAERGLDAPLEEIARRAQVSIGTLYNHFPSRDALLDDVFPARLSALDRLAADALAVADPWEGFAAYIEGLLRLHAEDQGLSDALARRGPLPPEVAAACTRGLAHLSEILARAKESGRLRPDFTLTDLSALVLALSQFIRDTRTRAPDAWRRHLAFHLDGLRTEAAHDIAVPALPDAEVSRLFPGAGPA